MTRLIKRIGLVSLTVAFCASLVGNYLMIRSVYSQYRSDMLVRLDPTGALTGERLPSETKRPQKTSSVIYVGDSRIAMWRRLPGQEATEIINRGMGNETTAQMLLRLERDVV